MNHKAFLFLNVIGRKWFDLVLSFNFRLHEFIFSYFSNWFQEKFPSLHKLEDGVCGASLILYYLLA